MTPPPTVGKYQVQEALGAGSMGTVYRAFDPALTRVVALKMINFGQVGATPRELTSRFRIEARAAAQLSHPAIVTVFDYDDQDPAGAYIAMEYVEGGRLDQYIERRSALNLEDAVCLMQQVLAGLEYAHARGVIHRDIKPANLMLTRDGLVKITDFGVAKIVSLEDSMGTFRRAGTPRYMAPEQYNDAPIDHRVDIHAAGAVLYEVLTGTPVFTGTFAEIMYRICHEPREPLHGLPDRVEEALGPVVAKALEKDQQNRYSSAAQFAEALSAAWRRISDRPIPQRLSPAAIDVIMNRATVPLPEGGGSVGPGLKPADRPESDPETELLVHADGTGGVVTAVTGVVASAGGTPAPRTAPQRAHAMPEARPAPPRPELLPATDYPGAWPAGELAAVERHLAAIVGPVARVLVRRAAARASSPQELHRLLADGLHRTGERQRFLAAAGISAGPPPMPRLPTPSPDRPPAGAGINLGLVPEATVKRASGLLARHMGPIAVVLCRRAAALASDESNFYELLAERLTNQPERDRFLKDVRRQA